MSSSADRVEVFAGIQRRRHYAFDTLAEGYDAQFTRTRIGTGMRAAVWARCAAPENQAVPFQALAGEQLGTVDTVPFAGMLSNFGGLICVADLNGAAASVAKILRPGAVAILCMMGPCVPCE